MINSLLGRISPKKLGKTLMHEHIMCDYIGADFVSPDRYDRKEVVETMLPYLMKLKEAGCDTFVDATPHGSGRDVEILRECSLRSGLHFVTATGTFKEKGVSKKIRAATIDAIVQCWEKEFREGIGETGIKPGFIKIALDDGPISKLQEKILRAAARTSLKTGMAIQSHTLLPATILQAGRILEEEELPFDRFIWTHADCGEDLPTMIELGRRGMWIQIDSIGYMPYEKHVKMLRELIQAGILDRMLLSQDKGWFVVGKDKGRFVNPYHRLFTEFLPLCRASGIKEEWIDQMLVTNPAKVLDIKMENE
ncbi:MAG: hypothetical protein KAX49_14885 [Halanaerobiales bacterium]|nr:hypothetical protein [Halanaerobiales bacterium]